MEVSGQLHAPAALPPAEGAPGTLWRGHWMDLRAGRDAVGRRRNPWPYCNLRKEWSFVQKCYSTVALLWLEWKL